MTVLHTQYHCVECDINFKKEDAGEHKRETDHSIVKKLVQPPDYPWQSEKVNIVLDPKKEDEIFYCLDCKKNTVAPNLHKSRGHSVYKPKKEGK